MNRSEVFASVSQAGEAFGHKVFDQLGAFPLDSPKEAAVALTLTLFVGWTVARSSNAYMAERIEMQKLKQREHEDKSRAKRNIDSTPNPTA